MKSFSLPTGTSTTSASKADSSVTTVPPFALMASLAAALIFFKPMMTLPGVNSDSTGAEKAPMPANIPKVKMRIKEMPIVIFVFFIVLSH